MYLNTKIVNALMTLRALSPTQISRVTGISAAALSEWLEGRVKGDAEDRRLPFERQLEVIRILGIAGEAPRSDITHAWFLRESAFGAREETYEPLRTMLLYCGGCEVTLLAEEADPFAVLSAKTYFALSFEKFRAVLQISSAPFRSLAFSPADLPNMRWAGERAPLILNRALFLALTGQGESSPAQLDLERHKALELVHWKKIGELAAERGMGAPELARFLLDSVPVPATSRAIGAPTSAPPSATAAPRKETTPPIEAAEALFQSDR